MSEADLEKLTYEQAFTELERIANQLEEENRSLEESLALFERGQLLAAHCASLLEKAQLRIQKVSQNSTGQKDQ